MDEFRKKIAAVNKDRIKAFLQNLTAPCYESRLLKVAFPECQLLDMDALSLYKYHFLLFHLLYVLQDEYALNDQYLHIHFMRIYLTDYPEEGVCRYYDDTLNTFCRAACNKGTDYCEFHFSQIGGMQMETLSDRYFYLDTDNYDQFDAETAESFMNGAWEILAHHKKFQVSLQALDLPLSADKQMIRNKFRMLAKKYHPDHGAESHDEFNKINRAYRFLLRVVP